ncbi:DUF5944 family protein [Paenibacillus paeoniae]|uniref:Uncharacterized protein n=1 Tax=Paenibacillus paeoniae TaxID=2292705 RepID=A0A371PFG6_9BACL|nr:DUF5944 family protein [Paenibacillus paeoniae]REK74238.1 hypothetical protein DX130_16985 [Paenibacillus paeoniae]
MKLLHKLRNSDFQHSRELMRVFEKASVSEYKAEVNCTFQVSLAGEGPGIVRLRGELELYNVKGSSPVLTKAMVYFPERNYGLEFIKEASTFTIEWVFELRDPKEYFNLVLFDKNGFLVSSATYVFNAEHVVAYPIREKDLSLAACDSELLEDGDRLVFRTSTLTSVRGAGQGGITHTWQNVGQHVRLAAQPSDQAEVYESSLSRRDMCAGIWMIIATDEHDKLITQYVVQV